MRRRTVLALVAVCGLLGGVALFGLGAGSGGELTERWVSDTARDNEVNHHAVGVGPAGDIVVAPVAEVPHSDVPITDTSCALVRLGPGDGSTLWRAGLPAEDCFTHALTEPAIADVDGDGALEAVVSSTEDALVAHATGDGAEEWRVPLSTYGYGRPTVANVTPAPGPEVVTSDIQGGVVVAGGNGTVAWRFALNRTGWSTVSVWQAPAVEDFDADAAPEVLVGSNEGPVVLSAEGTVEWQRDGEAAYTATARIDDDAAVEVFTAGTAAVRAYDGRTGDLEWERDLANARFRTAADGDGDGSVELYVGRVGGTVVALDARTGETEWSTTVSDSADAVVPPPVLGDVDGDGGPEVVTALDGGTVAVLDAESGAELAAYGREVPVWTFPTVGDIDDDGSTEILVRYGDGRVVALDHTEGSTVVPAVTGQPVWIP
jgi:outer membrane protein assembly factor BamB